MIDPTMFRMPAEWEKQKGIWLQWPHENTARGYQRKLEGLWLETTEILKQHEIVYICVPDERAREHIESQLRFYDISLDNIEFHIILTDDVWVRDNGPTFVVGEEGELAAVNWRFNGWGGRFKDYQLDNAVPPQIAERLRIPLFSVNLVTEGGNIEVNGQGTLMTTHSAVLNDNRNPGITQGEVEEIFKKYLGVKNFIWLTGMSTERPEEIGWSDDTDTHIDTVARFINPSTIVYSWTNDESDPMYPLLKKNMEELKEAVLESGRHPELIPLPIPKNGYYSTSQIGEGGIITKIDRAVRTDASYTNFLIANEVVLMPVYGNINDGKAFEVLVESFPDKKVLKVNSGVISENGGEIHCVTQQQPEGKTGYFKVEG